MAQRRPLAVRPDSRARQGFGGVQVVVSTLAVADLGQHRCGAGVEDHPLEGLLHLFQGVHQAADGLPCALGVAVFRLDGGDGGQGFGPPDDIGDDGGGGQGLLGPAGVGQRFGDVAQCRHDQTRIADAAHRRHGLGAEAGLRLGRQDLAEGPVAHVLLENRLGALRGLGQQATGGRTAKTGRRIAGRVGHLVAAALEQFARLRPAQESLAGRLGMVLARPVQALEQGIDLGCRLDLIDQVPGEAAVRFQAETPLVGANGGLGGRSHDAVHRTLVEADLLQPLLGAPYQGVGEALLQRSAARHVAGLAGERHRRQRGIRQHRHQHHGDEPRHRAPQPSHLHHSPTSATLAVHIISALRA